MKTFFLKLEDFIDLGFENPNNSAMHKRLPKPSNEILSRKLVKSKRLGRRNLVDMVKSNI